jgi:hypothetical protein
MHLQKLLLLILAILAPVVLGGCSLVPEKRMREQVHNPFPQLKRVAVLPFFNQSENPTVDADAVALQYYAELQSVPGFEVLPMGVTRQQLMQFIQTRGEPVRGEQFQELARFLDVEAVIVGSITDFDAYYPPRMAMTTHWYAANEGFHPIPAGYGLPWGTEAEERIPRNIVREAEFELARSQLASQTPTSDTASGHAESADASSTVRPTSAQQLAESQTLAPIGSAIVQGKEVAVPEDVYAEGDRELGWQPDSVPLDEDGNLVAIEAPLPPQWPNPEDLIPDPPAESAAPLIANHHPVLSHTKLYRGDDPSFTERLSDYVETGDDARPDGWKGYLRRSDDFVRFCCHAHIVEMLESRGGRDQSDLILRWPMSRY